MKKVEATPPHLKWGIVLTLIGSLFSAVASAFVYSFPTTFPTIQIVFLQNLISLLCTLPFALRKGLSRLKTRELPLHVLRDAAGVGSYFLFFLAVRSLNLVDAMTLNNTVPFFIPFIWLIWQRERIQKAVWWSIIVGFIGVAIILNPSRSILQWGFAFGLSAGLASAIALTALRILNVRREPMSRTLFYYFSLGTLATFPFALLSWHQPTFVEWMLAIGIGVTISLGQILLTLAYRYGTASFLSPLAYVTVIYSALIAMLFFDQELGWRSLVGSILIIGGGTMTYIFKKQPESVLETFERPDVPSKPPL